VGRGQGKSYCILVSDAKNEEAVQRMKVLCASNDGFHISEEDLKLRGPGDFFGARQHGLPQLKVADLAGDTRVTQEAQEAARHILAQDPDLSLPQHEPIRQSVVDLFRGSEDIFN
jgi:ATP-dependent DNA helicase RecG